MNLDKLHELMDMIINEEPLPPERRNHSLHGKWEGSCQQVGDDCHVQGDWALIYRPNYEERSVTFQRTGSHADLF
jgi:mRNA interferase YafQ